MIKHFKNRTIVKIPRYTLSLLEKLDYTNLKYTIEEQNIKLNLNYENDPIKSIQNLGTEFLMRLYSFQKDLYTIRIE